MKFSVLLTILVIGFTALFAVTRHQKINALTAERTKLETRANELGVSSDPDVYSDSKRVRTKVRQVAREEKMNDLAKEIIAKDLIIQGVSVRSEEGKLDMGEFNRMTSEIDGAIASLHPEEIQLLIKAISSTLSGADEDGDNERGLVRRAFQILAHEHPEAAFATFFELQKSRGFTATLSSDLKKRIFSSYVKKSPYDALQWFTDNQERASNLKIPLSIVKPAAREDMGQAISTILPLDLGISSPNHVISELSKELTAHNANAFVAGFRNGIVTDELRNGALRLIPSSNFFKDFEAASRWLEKDGVTSEEREIITNMLDYKITKNEPGKWLTWLSSSAEMTTAQTTATGKIIADWTLNDYVATGHWINAQPNGESKDESVHSYAQTLAPFRPTAAAEWALTLRDSKQRTALLETIHQSYQITDPQTATAFAREHGLTDQ